MNLFDSPWLKWLPPRIRAFFSRKPEITVHSTASDAELLERFRAGLHSKLWDYHGPAGYVRGSGLHVYWAMGMLRDSFTPVFDGRVEATPEGSVIRGRMSYHLPVQIFHGFWCGALILMALFLVWTIIVPLAAYGMLWMANGIMAIGDRSCPGREQKIEDFLRKVCGRAPSQ